MFWLDEHGDDGPETTAPGRADRGRLVGLLGALVAIGCLLIGAFVVVGAASGSGPARKSAVLPEAPFALDLHGSGKHIELPPVPTDPATPLPRNKNAAGGTTAPRPCSEPDRQLHLRIPRLCVSAPIAPVGIKGDALEIPSDVHSVGMWIGGQPLTDPHGRVGNTGTTLIVGHVDDADQGNGALHDLYLTKPGEAVYVTDAAGNTVRWRAIALQVVVKAKLPNTLFVGAPGPRRLYLVTCGGRLLHLPDGHGGTYGTYEDNVIVTLIPG